MIIPFLIFLHVNSCRNHGQEKGQRKKKVESPPPILRKLLLKNEHVSPLDIANIFTTLGSFSTIRPI